MLGLTTGFNIHSFAQKIKYTHLETAGPVSAGFSETRAHHLEQEEDAKRENWSGLQGVQPGRGRERGTGEGSSVLQASPVPRTWRRVESRGSKLLSRRKGFSFYSVDSGGNVGKRTD